MSRDHLMGYAPAMREDFEAPCWWESYPHYPLGWPKREMDAAANGCCRTRLGMNVTAASGRCMTQSDVDGFTDTHMEPERGYVAQSCDEPMLSVQEWVRPVREGTLSPGAEWQFSEHMSAQVRYEKAKKVRAMEQVQARAMERGVD